MGQLGLISSLILLFLFLFCNNGIDINNFVTPIGWNEISIPSQHSSMSAIIDSFGRVYLCGGKLSLFGESSKCIRIDVEKIINALGAVEYLITQTFSGGSGLKSAGPFPGLYLNAKAFTSESQNEGGIYGNRMCMLSISDGTNKPKCWCCNINELNNNQQPSNIKCDDLQYSITGGCPERFEACVIYDAEQNMIYQIGGYYGQTIYDSILCFDLTTETYIQCPFPYTHLDKAMYGIGCTLMANNIVTVGGMDTVSTSSSTTYIDTITVCNHSSASTSCNELTSLTLPRGVLKTRVFNIDNCHIGIVGGTILQMDGTQTVSDEIYIANICTQQWVYNDTLPAPLSQMAIIKTNDVFCLYGGISFDAQTYLPQLSNSAFCTNLDTQIPTTITTETPTTETPTTQTPTTQTPTTQIPTTSIPTTAPTQSIDLSMSFIVNFTDSSFSTEFITFNEGMSAQICYSDPQYLYVCGGTNSQQCLIYNEYKSLVLSLPIYVDNVAIASNFFCETQCSVMYDEQLFVINPVVDGQQQQYSLYKCMVSNNAIMDCINLCGTNNGVHYCQDLLPIDACITAHNEYLYISGGHQLAEPSLLDTITVFDMRLLDWYSVPPNSFPAKIGYNSYFAALSMPIASHSCSVWNSSLYVIGGKDENDASSSSIQICTQHKECQLSANTLVEARYNARSKLIGRSIVTLCGSQSLTQFTEKIEVYDIINETDRNIETRASYMSGNGGRTDCCVMDWKSQSKLIISGGLKRSGYRSVAIDNMIYSPYTLSPYTGTGSADNEDDDLLRCKNINVDTRDFSFKALYSIYNVISDYFIYATADKKAYLIIDASGIEKTWIYNYTERTSCFFNSNGEEIAPGIGPGLWTKPRTRYSQTVSILITLSCNENNAQLNIAGNNVLIYYSEAVSITIIVVIALIIITIVMVGFFCWLKKTNHRHHHYQVNAYNSKKKKKKKQLQQQQTQQAQHVVANYDEDEDEDEDEDDGEDTSDVSSDNGGEKTQTITIIRYRNTTTEDEDDDDDDDEEEESSCTVNPHEVIFSTSDKNTHMFDNIAMQEIQRQEKYEKRIKIDRRAINPQYRIPEAIQEPSALHSHVSQTPQHEHIANTPVIVSCPPPPPPVQATMFIIDSAENSLSHNVSLLSLSKDNYAGHVNQHISKK